MADTETDSITAEATFTTEQRRQLAKKGQALPDGSFPIRNVADLQNAIQAFGRGKDKGRVKAWIIRRARALGAVNLLPDEWGISEAITTERDFDFLEEALDLEEADPKRGRVWDVVIIRSGVSANGRRYSSKVLKEAAPLFEGARVLSRADEDHISQRQKAVSNIVGWLTEARFENGAVRATFTISEAADWLRVMLLDAWEHGKRDLVGLSIVAEGRGRPRLVDGVQLIEVEAIEKVASVDVIFDPAAGGGLVKLVAAASEDSGGEPAPPEAPETEAGGGQGKEEDVSLENLTADELRSARPDLVEELTAGAAGGDDGETEAEEKQEEITEAEGKKDEEDLVPKSIGRFVVREALEGTKLPDPVRKRIERAFGSRAFAHTELEEAVKAELETWAELEKANLVASEGEPRIEIGLDERMRAKAALDGFFEGSDVTVDGEKVARYRSFREAYVDLTGDTRITGMLPRRPSGKLGISEADGGRVAIRLTEREERSGDVVRDEAGMPLYEATISTTQFNVILGDSITRKMVQEYARSNLRTWDPFVDVIPVADFRTQRRERFGGYGNLPSVAEGAAYAALTSPTDEEATWSPTKYGGTETVNLEAIANDDLGAIRRIPTRLARAGAQTLHEFIYDFFDTNPNIYDATALFAAGHNNLGAAALSTASLRDGRVAMRSQTELDSAKALGLVPAWLWVPNELEELAFELTQSQLKPGTADNDASFVRSWGLSYAVVDYWTDANNWYLSAGKDQTPLFELGFFGGEEPEIFTQDMPNVGSMFTNDQTTFKIRHVYGGAILDFRGFYGAVVA